MALSNTNITSTLVSTLARAVVANSAYLTRGAFTDINVDPNLRPGMTHKFVANKISASDFNSNGQVLDDGCTFDTYELAVKAAGVAVKPAKLERALAMGDFKAFCKEVAPAVVNKLASSIAAMDVGKLLTAGNYSVATGTESWRKIAQVSTALKAKFQGKELGFFSPSVTGAMLGEGRNFVPVSVEPQFGKDLEGSLYGISEVRTTNVFDKVPCFNSYVTATADVTWSAMTTNLARLGGVDTDSLCAYTYANHINYGYIVGDNGAIVWVKGADQSVAGNIYAEVYKSTKLSATSKDKKYDLCLLRGENAMVWKEATQLLDGDKEVSDTVEGVAVAMEKRPGTGSFETIYNFAVAGVAGLGDITKAHLIAVEVI